MKPVSWFHIHRWTPHIGPVDAPIEAALRDIASRSGLGNTPDEHLADIYWSASAVIDEWRPSMDEVREWVEDPTNEAGAGTHYPKWISASRIHAQELAAVERAIRMIDELSQSFADGLPSQSFARDLSLDFQDALVRHAMKVLRGEPPPAVRSLLASIIDPQIMLSVWQTALTKERNRQVASAPKKGNRADNLAKFGIEQIALGWILLQLDEGRILGDAIPTARNGGMLFCGDVFELCAESSMSHSVLRKRLQEFRTSFPDNFGVVLTETEAANWKRGSAVSMAACRIADAFSNLFPLCPEINHPPHVVRYLKRREAYYAKMRRLRI